MNVNDMNVIDMNVNDMNVKDMNVKDMNVNDMNMNDTSVEQGVRRTQHIGKLYPPRMMKSGVNGESDDTEKTQRSGEWRKRVLHQSRKNLKLRKINESGMRRERQHGVAMPSMRLTREQITGDERLRKMKRTFAVIGRSGIVNVRE